MSSPPATPSPLAASDPGGTASPRADGLPAVSPDFVEQDYPLDNTIPTRGYDLPPMVCLGGSAGSLAALQAFFAEMPPDSGMVFVVVVHLSPEHASILPELLGRCTAMRVRAAQNGERVEANCVYVIPPGKQLTTLDGHLRLNEIDQDRGTRVAVDLFFRSMADTHGPHATAIVLSGADGDGALGIKRIKERGGLTVAQDPHEAEHRSMPQTAISTGMVDWVLGVREMPGRLLAYRTAESRLSVPPEEGPQPALAPRKSSDANETALREVLALLQIRTGRDFSYYKRATIVRRVARRLQINDVEDLPTYLSFLRTHPGEAGALLQDLLISVTNFFRDREAFAALKPRTAELFQGKGPGDTVRVWCPACATGEEVYSLAMLLMEQAREFKAPPAIQVFGCDLDDSGIQTARAGFYPSTIAADVSEERLQHFFVKDPRGWRVRREVREIVLFATHDLLKDAPFSRMDLVSCRNLLIYLDRSAQDRALDLFHFALRPGGILFLGASEAVADDSPLFQSLDKKYRIFRQHPGQGRGLPLPVGSGLFMQTMERLIQAKRGPLRPGASPALGTPPAAAEKDGAGGRVPLGELHFRLIERFAPPSLVVNANHEIVHLSEHAGQFLQFTGGEPSRNLLHVVHPMLRAELSAALFQVMETGAPVEVRAASMEVGGTRRGVHFRVAPARELAPGYLLVVFEFAETPPTEAAGPVAPNDALVGEPAARQLEREAEAVKMRLRDTTEQYEANTEELQASNEELQAMNEELRSASEELETSREELHSINEELTTVNQELKGKLEDLSHANSDLHNLIVSTAIATVFLDRDLRIMRYTPSAVDLFHLIPGDLGRPLGDLRHHLEYPELTADARRVLEHLTPVEHEVRAKGHWYLARLLPYRTLDDHIGGVVLTFVDVTEAKRASEAQRLGEERLRMILESARDYAIFTLDLERRVTTWNSGAQAIFGYSEAEILGQSGDILFIPEDRAEAAPQKETEGATDSGRAQNERVHLRRDGARFYGSGTTQPLRDAAGEVSGFVKIMRDLSEQRRMDALLHEKLTEMQRFNTAAVGREMRMIELKKEINALATRLGEEGRYPLDFEAKDAAEDKAS